MASFPPSHSLPPSLPLPPSLSLPPFLSPSLPLFLPPSLSLQVCLEKEREKCISLELHLTEVEDQLESQTKELGASKAAWEKQQGDLEAERENSRTLQARVNELTAHLESQNGGGNGIQRNFSFTSSDMQVRCVCVITTIT